MSDLMNLPGAMVKVRFLEAFKDGTIFGSKNYRVDEEAEISVDQYNKAKRSGAVMENKGVKLPEPDWGENAPVVAGVDPALGADSTVVFVPAEELAPEPYSVPLTPAGEVDEPRKFEGLEPYITSNKEPDVVDLSSPEDVVTTEELYSKPEPAPEPEKKPRGRRSQKAGKDGKA